MEDIKEFQECCVELGTYIANGGEINRSDLLAIYDNLNLVHIKPELLPGERTVVGTASMRKDAIFAVAEKLWGISPEEWLRKENDWLNDARLLLGKTGLTGKDHIDDVISAEILVRIVAVAHLIKDKTLNSQVSIEAIRALNITLSEVCTKGRTRMIYQDDRSVYGILKDRGVLIGTGGGKYLPNPEASLPELLMILVESELVPEAYNGIE